MKLLPNFCVNNETMVHFDLTTQEVNAGHCYLVAWPLQQLQQHSLLSQASWGRLEMKPKRHKGHGSGTLIASLQALLSKATSSEIFQSLRSLLTDSSQVSLGLPLPLFTLSTRFRTPLRTGAAPQEASVGYAQTISTDVG